MKRHIFYVQWVQGNFKKHMNRDAYREVGNQMAN